MCVAVVVAIALSAIPRNLRTAEAFGAAGLALATNWQPPIWAILKAREQGRLSSIGSIGSVPVEEGGAGSAVILENRAIGAIIGAGPAYPGDVHVPSRNVI